MPDELGPSTACSFVCVRVCMEYYWYDFSLSLDMPCGTSLDPLSVDRPNATSSKHVDLFQKLTFQQCPTWDIRSPASRGD